VSPAAPPRRIACGGGSIWVGEGLLADAARYLESPSGRYLLLATDSARAAADAIRASLPGALLLDFQVEDGEAAKTLATVEEIAEAALAAGVRRDDAFIVVGGGAATDVGGLAAALLLRGVAWNAVPTTTAGMSDAAIGGKTAVNHPRGKNLLGAFHPPRTVLADPAALATLPERDFRAGLVEAFKAAWIADADLAARSQRALPAILAREPGALVDLIAGAARVKADIVESDPRDSGRRRILNFGHTLGHALEAAGGFGALRHGEAVAWGIAAALEVSRRLAGLPEEDAASVRATLSRLGPFPQPERDPARLRPILALDKKATAAGIAGILLEAVGRARVEESVPAQDWLDAAAIMSLS
jgi:3-dehydroquinate synthase